MSPFRVVVVDDHPDVRAVIATLLSFEGRFEVVGEGADGADAVRLAESEHPDIVLLDLAMPNVDGLSALPEIQAVAPGAQIVVLSGFGTDRTVQAAMEAGAVAFLHKDARLAANLVPLLNEVARQAGPGTDELETGEPH